MTYLDKQEFLAWACDEPLANTTRGVLAEYIVAKALGTLDTKRVEWDKYDLRVDGIGVEVKSAAYVQSFVEAKDGGGLEHARIALLKAGKRRPSSGSRRRRDEGYLFQHAFLLLDERDRGGGAGREVE